MKTKIKYWAMFLCLCAFIVLPSCDTARVIRGEVAVRSADAADQSLETADWAFCEGATIGSLKRKYPVEEDFQKYLEFCDLGE